jgi:uridylate kinase
MGMLGTVINSLAAKDSVIKAGGDAIVMTSTFMEPYARRYSADAARAALSEGKIVFFGGGTGNPYFTTDTTAALRALEVGAQALLKATKVNGIYSADPVKNPDAVRFERLTFQEVLEKRFAVMDTAAFSLCADNNLHILVFDFAEEGALVKVLQGDFSVGTVVGN